jgi:hypothetical protein
VRRVTVLVSVLAIAAAASVLTATPASAAAATPCWKKVIQDWSRHTGAIKGHYSTHCLNQAIKHAPEDLRDYTSIIDDISALLYAAGEPPQGGGANGTEGSSPTQMGRNTPAPPSAKELKRQAEKAVPGAGTTSSIPDSSRSLPLPLLILAALAVAATLAAAAPPLLKRLRGRFPRIRPTAESVRPPS